LHPRGGAHDIPLQEEQAEVGSSDVTAERAKPARGAYGFTAPEPGEDHPDLAQWESNVGSPVALDLVEAPAVPVHGLTVLCWNVAIGTARLDELLAHLRAGAFRGLEPDDHYPLVLLLQEVYRSDESIAPDVVGRSHGGRLRPQSRTDIVELAHRERLSLRYVPSMRNGPHRSDRGNAILSTVPIRRARWLQLPYVRQRRVAVSVELAGVDDLALVSAHLDTGGRLRSEARVGRIGGGRLAQAQALGRWLTADERCIVLGADLNTALGLRDPVILALVAAGLHPALRCGRWWHTFHGPLPLLLDHVLFRSPRRRVERVEVNRLDEVPGDDTRRVFGSDHHPLLARVRFTGAPPPAGQAAGQRLRRRGWRT
jgi:endonuclease/exonuclease/phosphatase family metal-dependent hydrolase